MNFFGKKKIIPSTQTIIQNLYSTIDMLDKREMYLDKMILGYKNEAKKYVKTNKPKAIMLLKKAKMNEKQLSSIYGQKENIEAQINALEQSITTNNTIMSLRQGQEAISNISEKLNTDDIEELMDNISENLVTSTEISDIMSRPIGEMYDEDDLLNELNDEDEDLNELPKIPSKEISKEISKETRKEASKKEMSKEDKELEELKQMLLV